MMATEPMFGTIMIGRSSTPVEQMRSIVRDWAAQIGEAAGFVDERCLVTDDGRLLVCVRFRDRASYLALTDHPEQAAWWESGMRPLLNEDPEWIDRPGTTSDSKSELLDRHDTPDWLRLGCRADQAACMRLERDTAWPPWLRD